MMILRVRTKSTLGGMVGWDRLWGHAADGPPNGTDLRMSGCIFLAKQPILSFICAKQRINDHHLEVMT